MIVFVALVMTLASVAGVRGAVSPGRQEEGPVYRSGAGPAARLNLAEPEASPIAKALKAGNYPWYDAQADRVQPVWPIKMSFVKWLGKRMESFFKSIDRFLDRFKFDATGRGSISGNVIGTALLLSVLFVFVVCLLVLWLRRETGTSRNESRVTKLGTIARLDDLPEGIRSGAGDPWAEAQRRRAAGDLSGAIVCLFAHQLLALDQLGLIRLAPGRTGRHYVSKLRDHELVESLGATLRLFEDVYYGRRPPTAEAFESAWKRAMMFQERWRALLAGASP